jgi:hypothetical protein
MLTAAADGLAFLEYFENWVYLGLVVWVPSWGIRYRFKLDLKPDQLGRILRWLAVAVLFVSGSLPIHGFEVGRVILGSLGLINVAWPNFAVHLARALGSKPSATIDVGGEGA